MSGRIAGDRIARDIGAVLPPDKRMITMKKRLPAFLFRLWAGPGILYSGHSDLIAHDAGLLALEGRALSGEHRWPLASRPAVIGWPNSFARTRTSPPKRKPSTK